jgi:hypothetical protein
VPGLYTSEPSNLTSSCEAGTAIKPEIAELISLYISESMGNPSLASSHFFDGTNFHNNLKKLFNLLSLF